MRVLLVEDDSNTAQSIELILKSEGYIVDSTDLGEDGLEIGKLYEGTSNLQLQTIAKHLLG